MTPVCQKAVKREIARASADMHTPWAFSRDEGVVACLGFAQGLGRSTEVVAVVYGVAGTAPGRLNLVHNGYLGAQSVKFYDTCRFRREHPYLPIKKLKAFS